MENKRVIGFYDYTVVLTYLGMVIAFDGIIQAIHGNFGIAIICLMFAGVCDMFDGAVASTKDRNCYEKHFGIQIDSMCDLISFGVLPAIIVYMITGEKIAVGVLSCAYTLCGLIRLAYFNVQEFERQQQTEEKRETYLGVPITTSAILMPMVYLLYSELGCVGTVIFPIALMVLGIGFIAGKEIKKPGRYGKIAMIFIGILEIVGVILLSFWE